MTHRQAFLVGASVFALIGAPALAQATATPEDDAGISEIVVTAQKRAQNLQDVSAAVTALDGAQLARSRVTAIEDLQVLIPTVSFGQDFNIAKIFIRGIGQNTSTAGSEPGVSLHLDGAVIARPEAQLTGLFDLERVEVLRGPQGSLYGRNSTGGSINLITAKPTADYTGYATASYGNYNLFQVNGAVSGPIVEGVRGRFAFQTENRDGFGRNPVTGNDVDGSKRWMARAQLEFRPTSDITLLLSGDYYRQNDSTGAIHFRRASFPTVARLAPLGVGGYATNPRDVASEFDVGTNTKSWALTGTLTVKLTDKLTLTNLTNYRKFDTAVTQDLDVSSVVESLVTNGQGTTVQRRYTRSRQFSNELRLAYDSRYIDVVGGLYYFNEQQNPADTIGLTPTSGEQSYIALIQAAGIPLSEAYQLCQQTGQTAAISAGTLAPMRVCGDTRLGTKAYAAFGQAVVGLGALTPALDTVSVKIGGRYSAEDRSSQNPSIVLAAGGRGPVIRNTVAGTFRERSFKDFTPELGLEWRPVKDVLVYYTYSEGFKAGSGENSPGSTTIVDPETVTNHEAGIKATLFDRKLSVNLSGYSYKLRNLQINKTIAGGAAGFTTIFQNAAATSGKGLELEISARPVRILRIGGSLAYTDSKFTDFLTIDPLNPVNVAGGNRYNPALASGALLNPALPRNDDPTAFGGPCGTDAFTNLAPCNINLAGNSTRNTPEWTWNIHADLDLPIPESAGSLTVSGDIAYKSTTFFTEFSRLIEGAEGYAQANASLNYRTANERFKASLWVKNLADIYRPSSTFALATGRIVGVTYLPPRTYGATVGFSF